MSRNIIRLLASFLLAAFANLQTAYAATFDFVAAAAGNERGSLSEVFTDGGFSVTVSGRNLAGTLAYLAYLDDLSGGEPGGLGVCKALGGSECDPSDDDNIGELEVLELVFSSPVQITSIEFSNGTHLDNYLGNFGIAIDSNPTAVGGFTQYPSVALFTTPLFGTSFRFISNSSISGLSDVERLLYISKLTATGIPEPMTLSLLGLGLVGLLEGRRPRSAKKL